MEKIQKALQKARSNRENAPASPVRRPSAVSAAPTQASAPAPGSIEAAWAALPPLPISRERMLEHRVMTLEHQKDAIPFDVMRTKVAQTMRANGWRRLAITSPTPACGKSTVTLNLAFSFARQPEIRVVVGELDLRRPALGNILDIRPETGIDAILQGATPFADQAVAYNGNLAFSLANRSVRDASELLQSESVGDVLTQIEAQYEPDLMLFDMPPMLANDDMMAFAPHVDCVLIIAGAESTTIKQVDICERELAAQTNVLGVVLNKCNYMGDEQGYYSYGE
jgi:Mrp family chromosome partitioning ATPase